MWKYLHSIYWDDYLCKLYLFSLWIAAAAILSLSQNQDSKEDDVIIIVVSYTVSKL